MAQYIEDDHQKELVSWAQRAWFEHPMLGLQKISAFLYAIPNGGKRNKREAARLKAQGVKAGVSDLNFPVAMSGYNGLWIEMKRPIVKGQSKPTVQATQREWLRLMTDSGHKAVVCYGFDEARQVIREYVGKRSKK